MTRGFVPRPVFLIALATTTFACGGGGGADDDDSIVDASTPTSDAATEMDGGAGIAVPSHVGPEDRRARVIVPNAHDGTTPLPLVFLLHGYTASASVQDAYFRMSAHARDNGYYLVLPDGTEDSAGNRFWNATDYCCDFGDTGVDDEGYLRALVHEMKELFPIDDARVYFVGHSNGGFMSYRMACKMADEVTAVVSLAGSTFADEADCGASQPVSVLQVHGRLDGTIAYDGALGYPSAPETVRRWALRAGCDTGAPTELDPIDLDSGLAGEETTVLRYEAGCAPGVDAELWTIEGGGHIPAVTDRWAPTVTEWLFRHTR